MMKSVLHAAFTCMFLGGIMTNVYADNSIEIEGIVFSLPECISVEKKTPVEDFTLVDFSLNNDTVILKGYMGNFPQKIYRDKIDFILNEFIISEYKTKHWSKRDTFNDISSGEIILELNNIEWPNYIQFWYNNVNDEMLDIIKKIILSIFIPTEKLPYLTRPVEMGPIVGTGDYQ